MPCVNHPGNNVQSYCQNCGKALCAECVRKGSAGQIVCETCLKAGATDPNQAYWQAAQSFATLPPGVPNPTAAAFLGLIPGVGAMYNGQLFKGLIHVVIFVVLVSITNIHGIFGLFVGAWILYQSFEAFHTAKARRDGLPVPDPFGLNEVGSWLNQSGLGSTPKTPPPPPPPGSYPGAPGPAQATSVPPAGTAAGTSAAGTPVYGATETASTEAAYTAPYTSTWAGTEYTQTPSTPYDPATGYQAGAPYQAPYQGVPPYTDPYGGGFVPPGQVPPGAIPPIPPIPPYNWRRREPVWAVVLIVLGVVFLLKSMGIITHLFFHFTWPILLIAIGVWLIVRRLGYTIGGSK